ncbi:membrane-bound O-acyltransferase family MBOAT [Eubacterium nodatum ATCC 33099]|nr:membrane-bound O-acyltransferase family MBOAT [Eubacterium nodatum ATCC 33099]
MTYTSFMFAVFALLTILVYYLMPSKKYQWVVLLIASFIFYMYNSYRFAFYIACTTASIYFAAKHIEDYARSTKDLAKKKKTELSRSEIKAFKKERKKREQLILAIALILNFGILFILKYYNFMVGGLFELLGFSKGETPFIKLFLPLGISFYTFQATGYLIDVYRGLVDAERNFFKFALFVSFFPQTIQGPISEFEQLGNQLTQEHKPEWIRFKLGCQLILWGLFKKLVIADRAIYFIQKCTNHYTQYNGLVIFLVGLTYALQLYTDFSGGIDISRGIAKILGIDMIDNFKRPYFSQSLGEYWRRWHISLGAWMKKYVFYSLAMSNTFMKLSNRIKKGEKKPSAVRMHLAKTLPSALAIFVVFMFVGLWHGANSKYVAFGVWNGAILMLSMLFKPVFLRMNEIFHVKDTSFFWKLFRIIRTFILVLVGYYFDIAKDFKSAVDMMSRSVFDWNISLAMQQLPKMLPQIQDHIILFVASIILFVCSILQERKDAESPGELTHSHSAVLQWIVIFIEILLVAIFGVYGTGADPADFVYMQF